MRCERIQELLQTDYLDGQASRCQQRDIGEHLAHCSDCRGLEKELWAQRMLFKIGKRQEAPERVWRNIRDAIVSQDLARENSLNRGIFQRLRDLILMPRPVFALASFLTVIAFVAIFAGTVLQKKQFFNPVDGVEILEVYSLSGNSDDLFDSLGTNVEEYFL